MDIRNSLQKDLEEILSLYQTARELQTEQKMVVWPTFDISLIETEIKRTSSI